MVARTVVFRRTELLNRGGVFGVEGEKGVHMKGRFERHGELFAVTRRRSCLETPERSRKQREEEGNIGGRLEDSTERKESLRRQRA